MTPRPVICYRHGASVRARRQQRKDLNSNSVAQVPAGTATRRRGRGMRARRRRSPCSVFVLRAVSFVVAVESVLIVPGLLMRSGAAR